MDELEKMGGDGKIEIIRVGSIFLKMVIEKE